MEILFEVPEYNADAAEPVIEEAMTNFPLLKKLSVPFPVDGGRAYNWLEAK